MPHGACSYLRILIEFLRIGGDYWLTIYPKVVGELRRWRRRAAAIPDPTLRAQALAALEEKRHHAEGAAAFAVLSPRAKRAPAIRFLVAFQAMYDYLDTVSEDATADPLLDTLQLHTALTDALLPGLVASAPYALHAHQDDGGYLAGFVDTCRASCSALPAFEIVAPTVRSAARLARQSQGYNHALPSAPSGFVSAVVAPWASMEGGQAYGLAWWETIGAAGSSLAVLVLVAAAGDAGLKPSERDAIRDVYMPWAGAVLALVDSVVDQARDGADDTHSLVSRYPSPRAAADRLSMLIRRALALARRTADRDRHMLIVASMVALFASGSEARAPYARDAIRSALEAAGPRGAMPLAVLRAKRMLSCRWLRSRARR